ncbi:MAG: hypothetical protein EAZ67_00955 [Cytophagales bacterium]|nr:MAG: hypothetical protein EAZ67_00955 [Cytophagales bacterium]
MKTVTMLVTFIVLICALASCKKEPLISNAELVQGEWLLDSFKQDELKEGQLIDSETTNTKSDNFALLFLPDNTYVQLTNDQPGSGGIWRMNIPQDSLFLVSGTELINFKIQDLNSRSMQLQQEELSELQTGLRTTFYFSKNQ